MNRSEPPIEAEPLEADTEVTLHDLCRVCEVHADYVIELVEIGVVEPRAGRRPGEWRFTPQALLRLRRAVRLHRDLAVEPAGAALVLDLMEEVTALRRRLRGFEP